MSSRVSTDRGHRHASEQGSQGRHGRRRRRRHRRPRRRAVAAARAASTCMSTSRRRRWARSAPASRSARTRRASCTGSGSPRSSRRTGVRPLAWHQRRWDDGRTLLRTPLAEPLEAAFGFPHYQMHRADLLAALAAALPAERIHLGHRLTGLADRGDRVEAQFANGARDRRSTCWSAPTASTRRCAALLFGPEQPALHRLHRLSRAGAGRAAARPRARGHGAGLDGSRPALRALLRQRPAAGQLRRRRRAGHLDARVLDRPRRGRATRSPRSRAGTRRSGAILGAVDETFIWALFDRTPLERWSVGPGDAARRRLPRDAAVHGPGRRPGDRGRGDAGRLPRRRGTRTSPRRCAATSGCASRGRRASRRCRRPTRRASTSPTARAAAARRRRWRPDATDWSFKAVAWIYEHDAASVEYETAVGARAW